MRASDFSLMDLGTTLRVNTRQEEQHLRSMFRYWQRKILPTYDDKQGWRLTKRDGVLELISVEQKHERKFSKFNPIITPPTFSFIFDNPVNLDAMYLATSSPDLTDTGVFTDEKPVEVAVEYAAVLRDTLKEWAQKQEPLRVYGLREQTIGGRTRFALRRID
jgi:hypothetical protein